MSFLAFFFLRSFVFLLSFFFLSSLLFFYFKEAHLVFLLCILSMLSYRFLSSDSLFFLSAAVELPTTLVYAELLERKGMKEDSR
mmetsp:Transcript_6341/g.12885  ORF Transcript_6341/g.12885 Transcript_6341/m.12885 type:complete len:84 (+) Transcript_6341:1032-1283(+)